MATVRGETVNAGAGCRGLGYNGGSYPGLGDGDARVSVSRVSWWTGQHAAGGGRGTGQGK